MLVRSLHGGKTKCFEPMLIMMLNRGYLAIGRLLDTLSSNLLTMLANPRWMSMGQHLILGFSSSKCQTYSY